MTFSHSDSRQVFFKQAWIVVLGLGIVLRLMLCLVNREANDDHMEAICLIADRKAIPEAWECAECFQPKAFYLMNAGVLLAFNITGPDARIIAIQMVNLVLSFFILWFIWKYLKSKPFSNTVRLMVFAFAALNPCLAGINGQVTNDTLIILLGVLSLYYADRFLSSGSWRDGLLMSLFVLLSPIVKGSGLVIAIGVFMLLSVHILFSLPEIRMRILKIGLMLFISCVAIVPFAGGYYYSYINYGTPFSTGIGPSANKRDSEPFRWRPGIQSVAGGYLTFRLGGMLEQPYINDDPDNFPLHRTSVWSQMYGRTMFLHFDQHPPSWKSTAPAILFAGRLALVLGLIPALLFLLGLLQSLMEFMRKYKFNIRKFVLSGDWHHLVFIAGFTGFIILYTRDYPDFSTMKSVFLFPALAAFLYAFAKGYSIITNRLLNKAVSSLLILLLCVHVFDIVFLINQLL
jgi:hypothetical protein